MSDYLALLCCITYIGSYLTRINFGAVTVEIIDYTGWVKTSVSAVTTGLFVTYGIGQLISGWLCDRYSPRKIVTAGLSVSVLMNILIPLCKTVPAMTAVWCVNGFAQAMLWPPIVRILSDYCSARDYQVAIMKVTWGCSFGTLAVYLISSLCIAVSGWKAVFFVCATLAGLIVCAWAYYFPKITANIEKRKPTDEPNAGAAEKSGDAKMPKAICIILFVILLATVILGALRDSITTWLPNYIQETFATASSSAVLSGAVIPLITIFIHPFVLRLYRRFFTNELVFASTTYAVAALASVLLFFVYDKAHALAVILLAIICASMHAANFMIIGLVPGKFSKFGNIGTISGIINSSVYIGSSVSIWGIAAIAQNFGWKTTITVWGLAAVAGVVICLAVSSGWVKYMHNDVR